MTAPQLTAYSNGPVAVGGDQLNTFMQTCDTAMQMRGLIGVSGIGIYARGMVSANDGLGGAFGWNVTSTGPDDNANTIVPFGAKIGAWVRVAVAGAQINITIAALKLATSATLPGSMVYATGYFQTGDGGAGHFYVGANTTANGGTIINDASGRSWYRETAGQPLSVLWFGAKGDGVTDDSPPFQRTIAAAQAATKAIYVPSAPVNYLLNTPLNITNLSQLEILGDGFYPMMARITPVGGSVLAGNTGAGGCVIDGTGTSGLVLRDLTIASIGLPNPSTVGIIMGNSSSNANGGSSCELDRVSILMPPTGASCPLYGVNVNLLTLIKLNTFGDYGVYLAATNELNITRPYGVGGSNIQSDGIASFGCFLGGYGTQSPFVLSNCTCHQHDQLYIVNINASSSFAGRVYAMQLNNCTDIDVKVEIDYFPSAVAQLGDWLNVNLSGIIFSQPSPLPANAPAVMAMEGTSLKGCDLNIRVLSAPPANTYMYSSASTSPTMVFLEGCSFIFDTGIVSDALFLDVTAAASIPVFNCSLNGNIDAATITLLVNGGAMPASAYRLWVNGLRTGTA